MASFNTGEGGKVILQRPQLFSLRSRCQQEPHECEFSGGGAIEDEGYAAPCSLTLRIPYTPARWVLGASPE